MKQNIYRLSRHNRSGTVFILSGFLLPLTSSTVVKSGLLISIASIEGDNSRKN